MIVITQIYLWVYIYVWIHMLKKCYSKNWGRTCICMKSNIRRHWSLPTESESSSSWRSSMEEMGLFLTSSTRAAGKGSPWNTQFTRIKPQTEINVVYYSECSLAKTKCKKMKVLKVKGRFSYMITPLDLWTQNDWLADTVCSTERVYHSVLQLFHVSQRHEQHQDIAPQETLFFSAVVLLIVVDIKKRTQ